MARRPGPAVRCHAHAKSTGERCRCYAIVGGKCCRVHGGASSRVRRAANLVVLRQWAIRSADEQIAAHRRRLVEWHVDRLITAAEVLGLDVEKMLRNPAKARKQCQEAHWLRPDLVPSLLAEPKFKRNHRYRAPKAALRNC